jgi:hypothetical protein
MKSFITKIRDKKTPYPKRQGENKKEKIYS